MLRKAKLPRGALKGCKYLLRGGPWNGDLAFVPLGGTMVFKLHGWYGRYTEFGHWIDV